MVCQLDKFHILLIFRRCILPLAAQSDWGPNYIHPRCLQLLRTDSTLLRHLPGLRRRRIHTAACDIALRFLEAAFDARQEVEVMVDPGWGCELGLLDVGGGITLP